MTANIAFSLTAAVVSLAIVVLAGLKGDWGVSGVYAALVLGFLARASFGRGARVVHDPERPPEEPEPDSAARRSGPEHEPERRLKPARFRRR